VEEDVVMVKLDAEDWKLLEACDYDRPPMLDRTELPRAEKLIELGYLEINPTGELVVRCTEKGERLRAMRRKTKKISSRGGGR
jgi:hypothetical protein